MLKRKRPATLPATLTITGQGETEKFTITYNNLPTSAYDQLVAESREKGGISHVVLGIVKEWDTEFELTTEGVNEAEDLNPGLVIAVIQGYHDARKVQRAKN